MIFIAYCTLVPVVEQKRHINIQQQMHRRIELDRSDHELDNRLKLCAFFILLHFIHHAQSIYILSSCRIRLSVSLVV